MFTIRWKVSSAIYVAKHSLKKVQCIDTELYMMEKRIFLVIYVERLSYWKNTYRNICFFIQDRNHLCVIRVIIRSLIVQRLNDIKTRIIDLHATTCAFFVTNDIKMFLHYRNMKRVAVLLRIKKIDNASRTRWSDWW